MGSFGYNQQEQSSSSSSNVWDQQSPFLQQGYQQLAGLLGNQSNANAGMAAGQNFIDNQFGGIFDPAMQGFQSIMNGSNLGMQTLQNQMSAGSTPGLDDAVNRTMTAMNKNFSEQTMPGLRNNAMQVGGLGGGRDAVAAGVAAGNHSANVGNTVGQMYFNDAQAVQARQGQAAQAYLGQQQQAMAGAQGLAQLGMTPMSMYGQMNQMPWQNISNYMSLLGGPVMTSQSQGSSSGWGMDSSFMQMGGGG